MLLLMIKSVAINADDVRMMVIKVIRGYQRWQIRTTFPSVGSRNFNWMLCLQALRESAFGLGQDVGAEHCGEIGEGHIEKPQQRLNGS